GMKYRVLALDPYSKHMSLPVLRKIRDLVAAGATVVGDKPTGTPSLADDVNEFSKISDALWGNTAGEHSYQKGQVFSTTSIQDALNALNVAHDFEFSKPESETKLQFVHRKLADGDLYFIDNRPDHPQTLSVTFPVHGRHHDLRHPDTGATDPAAFTATNDRTTIPLNLEPWGTTFIVLRKPTNESARKQPQTRDQSVATIDGPWEITFQENRGAPAK